MNSGKLTKLEYDWREYFEYDNGLLIYKKRKNKDYKTKSACKKFNTLYAGKVAGSIEMPKSSNTPYLRIQLFKKRYFVHRIVWEMHNGKIAEGMVIDHINRNGLDNRIDNLRCVSHRVNLRNKKTDKRNTSGKTGVTWDKHAGKWKAFINFGGRKRHIGNFSNIEHAIQARLAEELRLGYISD